MTPTWASGTRCIGFSRSVDSTAPCVPSRHLRIKTEHHLLLVDAIKRRWRMLADQLGVSSFFFAPPSLTLSVAPRNPLVFLGCLVVGLWSFGQNNPLPA